MEHGIQVFIFIEKSVNAEYSTYSLNKGNVDVKYRFADNVRIFQFIEELHQLPANNAIATFETAHDIGTYLRSQFAGLFHRFLQENKRAKELRVLEEMNQTARTLKSVVDFLIEQNKEQNKNSTEALFCWSRIRCSPDWLK